MYDFCLHVALSTALQLGTSSYTFIHTNSTFHMSTMNPGNCSCKRNLSCGPHKPLHPMCGGGLPEMVPWISLLRAVDLRLNWRSSSLDTTDVTNWTLWWDVYVRIYKTPTKAHVCVCVCIWSCVINCYLNTQALSFFLSTVIKMCWTYIF